MKKRGRKPIDKSVHSEDWCFRCKEGGDLTICDYGQCLKTYHAHCVDESLMSEEYFECERHRCFRCKKRRPSVHCYCCPKAVCLQCLSPAEFVCIRKKDGFCADCLNLVLLIEENRDVTADGVTVDFKDLQTFEGLFMDYYAKVIKEKIGLTIEVLSIAKDKLMRSNYELDDSVDEEDDEMESDYEGTDTEEVFEPNMKRKYKNGLQVKRPKKVKSNDMLFTGWGSTCLIQFLESIGEDTSEEIPQRKVDNLINAYVNKNKLFDPSDKKKIRCDEKLLAVFGRKFVKRNKIYELLESHYANDLEISEDEDVEEEMTFDGTKDGCKTRRNLKEDKGPLKVEKVCHVSESCFAALCVENIKLVYLRRSLLQELSKEPESFEQKVKGSFIRLKTDPNDRFQRNSHQLLRVKGIKKSSSCQSNGETVLHVANMPFEIRIGSLSDADIEEAECAELKQKVKDGSIRKPTVVELQEKARSLHEDITKNWIARELKLLESRINQANDKGRRQEMSEYITKRKLLQSQTEQLRLLQTYPTVTAEELEPLREENESKRREDEALPESVFSTGFKGKWGTNGISRGKKYLEHVSSEDRKQNFASPPLPASADQGSACTTTTAATVEGSQDKVPVSESQYKGKFLGEDWMCSSASNLNQNQGTPAGQASTRKSNRTAATTLKESPDQKPTSEFLYKGKFLEDEGIHGSSATNLKQNQGTHFERASTRRSNRTVAASSSLKGSPDQVPTPKDQCNTKIQVKETSSSSVTNLKQNEEINTEDTTPKKQGPSVDKAVMDLSSDEDSIVCTGSLRKQNLEDGDSKDSLRKMNLEDLDSKGSSRKKNLEDPDRRVWFVVGPDGERKGTYTLSLLKAWSEASAYALKFKAWKETQTEDQAIWLGDAIKLAFAEN